MPTNQPSVKVVQQPPAVVLVGDTFEIRVVSETDGISGYELVLDDCVSTTTQAKSVTSGVTVTFQCSCEKPMTDHAIQVKLLGKKGKVVATAETSTVSVTVQKVKIATKNWTSTWYKDEGGREKSIDLLASLQPRKYKTMNPPPTLCLKPTLWYAPSSSGLVAVANQDILRVLSGDLSLGEDGSRLVRLRIEDVSKNHQGQDFQIQIGIADHPEILPGLSPFITVRSKRNKRIRATLQSSGKAVLTAVAKRPTAVESKKQLGPQIQQALGCVLKWSDDVASVLHVSSNPAAATFLSQYGYIRDQLLFLQSANADKGGTASNHSEALVPSPHHAPPIRLWQEEQRYIDTTDVFPVFENSSQVSGHTTSIFLEGSHEQARSVGVAPRIHGSSSTSRRKDEIVKSVEPIEPELLVKSGTEKGRKSFSDGDSYFAHTRKDGSIEEATTKVVSGITYEMRQEINESNVLSRSLRRDGLLRSASERVRPWNDSAATATCHKAETSNDNPNRSPSQSFEDEVEYVLAVFFKSNENDECLGFPVFDVNKRFVGFLREGNCRHGGFDLSPPPGTFGPREMDEANRVLGHHPSDAIFSKEMLRTIKAMLHHALVYSWRSNP